MIENLPAACSISSRTISAYSKDEQHNKRRCITFYAILTNANNSALSITNLWSMDVLLTGLHYQSNQTRPI
jgi:hypothetical protein